MVAIIDPPSFVAPRVERHFHGWFVGPGGGWLEVASGPGVRILSVRRLESPDLLTHFRAPALGRQRFALAIDCPQEACRVELRLEGGGAFAQDMATLPLGSRALGGAQ